MTVLVFNRATNRMERYILGLASAMPYNENRTLTVDEFRARSRGSIVWTDTGTMAAWNTTRRIWNRPIDVGAAFRRIWEGGHANQSQHYAGTSFDVGQRMSAADRVALHRTAAAAGVWTFVEPLALTPTWVHFDRRFGVSACPAGGFPLLRQGAIGNYVCVLQDALNFLGFSSGTIDGMFGPNTRDAVVRYQRSRGLGADGIVGCVTWTRLTAETVGRG
jgi:hypothetical protein